MVRVQHPLPNQVTRLSVARYLCCLLLFPLSVSPADGREGPKYRTTANLGLFLPILFKLTAYSISQFGWRPFCLGLQTPYFSMGKYGTDMAGTCNSASVSLTVWDSTRKQRLIACSNLVLCPHNTKLHVLDSNCLLYTSTECSIF